MSSFFKKDLEKIPRPEQIKALEFIKENIKNKNTKFFMLDLPPGCGKSLLAVMFMDFYKSQINKNAKFDIITATKILQTQYVDDFKSITNLWGRDNYQCEEYGVDCSEGKKFCKVNKTTCENCPYDSSKGKYLSSTASLTNYHLYIIFKLFLEEVSNMREANVLIVDECHLLEDTFNSFISINISEFWLKKMKFQKAESIAKEFNKISSLDDFIDFYNKVLLNKVNQTRGELSSELIGVNPQSLKRDNKLSRLGGKSNDKYKILELLGELEQFKTKVDSFIKDYSENSQNWVLERNKNKSGNIDLSIMPVWTAEYLEKYIWSTYDHVILMSGTILNRDLFSFLNGIDKEKAAYINMDSPFPITNRPIYYMPLGKMSYNSKEETFKNYVPYIKKLLNKYKDKKGVIHTVTYELAEWVKNSIKDERLIFHATDSKDSALRKHYNSEDPTVVVSPSMATGVDFEGDKARFQILLKVPYPFLGSEKNKLRQKLMPDWYVYASVSAIIQAYGRIIRNYDDAGDMIILDGCFNDVMKYSGDWIPSWVWNAIKKVNVNINT